MTPEQQRIRSRWIANSQARRQPSPPPPPPGPRNTRVRYGNSTFNLNARGIPTFIKFHRPSVRQMPSFFAPPPPPPRPRPKGKTPKPRVGTNTLSRNLNWTDPIGLNKVKPRRAYYLQPNANAAGGTVHTVYSLRSLNRWLGGKGETTSPQTRIPYTRNNIRRVRRN